ncbi:nicotinamidase [Spirochaetia bacterium]|nr:nicotinamidase [Spirochaetia bacterium]
MTIDIARTTLIEIDIQNDFCPGGTLAVDRGDEVIGPLNALADGFTRRGGRVIATADWHPAGHISFASSHAGRKAGDVLDTQVLWPDHCVQGSSGADFHKALDLKSVNLIIRKGFRKNLDSYSAFFENDRKTPTGLEGYLKFLGIETVILGGLATDYCVLYSALDAAAIGLRTIVLTDAMRGVGFPEGSVERAFKSMHDAGVILASSVEVLAGIHSLLTTDSTDRRRGERRI